jgi:hypothetical protein
MSKMETSERKPCWWVEGDQVSPGNIKIRGAALDCNALAALALTVMFFWSCSSVPEGGNSEAAIQEMEKGITNIPASRGFYLPSNASVAAGTEQAGLRQQWIQETKTPLPGHIVEMIQRPDRPPAAGVIEQLTKVDEPILLDLYQRAPSLLEKRALTWALAYAGTEKAVAVLTHALTDEYTGETLTGGFPDRTDEEGVLINTVSALGLLAAEYDSAWNFLLKGVDPWWWNETVQWSSVRGDRAAGMLASVSIQALAFTGRPEVPDLLQKMKEQEPVNRVAGPGEAGTRLAGSISSAAFYDYLIRKEGMDYFRNNLLGMEDDTFVDWKQSPEGKEWHEWFQQTRPFRSEGPGVPMELNRRP